MHLQHTKYPLSNQIVPEIVLAISISVKPFSHRMWCVQAAQHCDAVCVCVCVCEDEEDLVSTESGGRSIEKMKNYLQDIIRVDSGPLGWWKKTRQIPESMLYFSVMHLSLCSLLNNPFSFKWTCLLCLG